MPRFAATKTPQTPHTLGRFPVKFLNAGESWVPRFDGGSGSELLDAMVGGLKFPLLRQANCFSAWEARWWASATVNGSNIFNTSWIWSRRPPMYREPSFRRDSLMFTRARKE
ncbi:unnamed protein product [Linum trigynum]|uniref:Uncharacterized protein n=1 Tax=Linum trigynum TaxID=586398 RepID=A0AAV2GM11_9ROSI